jgi:hypothetical protein
MKLRYTKILIKWNANTTYKDKKVQQPSCKSFAKEECEKSLMTQWIDISKWNPSGIYDIS